MKTLLLAAALALLLLAPLSASAQPLADKVPAEALVYIGWTGTDHMPVGYQDSHLKAMEEIANVPQLLREVLPRFMEKMQKQAGNADLGQFLVIEGGAIEVLQTVAKHPGAFYFGGVDFSGPQPKPRLALLCQAGPDAAAIQGRITQLLEQAHAPAGLVQTALRGDLVLVTIGQPVLPGPDQPAAATLKNSKRFAAALAQLHPEPIKVAYVDVMGVLALIDQAVARGEDEQARQVWPKVRDALGLPGIHQIALTSGFEGRDIGVSVFVDAPAPRGGILAMLESGPSGADAWALVPRTAATFGALRFDPAKILPLVRQVANQVDEQGPANLDAALAPLNAMVGGAIQKDLLAALGTQWVFYTDRNVTGTGIWGTACLSRLRDPAKAEQALGRLETALNGMSAQMVPHEVTLRVKTTAAAGATLHYLSVPLIAPTWAVKDGVLYLGLYPQTVAAAIDHAAAGGPSILENQAFVAMRERLGGKDPAFLSFIDEPQLIGENYQYALILSQTYLGMIDLLGVDCPPLLLPPIQKILPHMAPAGAAAWADAAGWHLRDIEPFPSSRLIADPGVLVGVAGASMGVGVMIPAFATARHNANLTKFAVQGKGIATAAIMWADAHGDKLPPDIGTLLIGDGVDPIHPRMILSPQSTTPIPPDYATMTPEQKRAWGNANCAFIYLGQGRKNDADATVIILVGKPQFALGGKVPVVYADTHAQSLPVQEAMGLIRGRLQARPPAAPVH